MMLIVPIFSLTPSHNHFFFLEQSFVYSPVIHEKKKKNRIFYKHINLPVKFFWQKYLPLTTVEDLSDKR